MSASVVDAEAVGDGSGVPVVASTVLDGEGMSSADDDRSFPQAENRRGASTADARSRRVT
jgi:hypothetical protein